MRAVILAGGSGTRLWPLSTDSLPKQFLSIFGERSMLQNTAERLKGLPVDSAVTVCNEKHKLLVSQQLQETGLPSSIILEPFSRNTAASIALAALYKREQDPLLLVVPSDHVISDQAAFSLAIQRGVSLAEQGKLVTFGILPTSPHIGYGYIEVGQEIGCGFLVNSFCEKPDFTLAEAYVAGRKHYWNSGIFLFRASKYLTELKAYHSEIHKFCVNAIREVGTESDFTLIDYEEFRHCPNESIDCAVMEKTTNAAVVPLDAGWDDIGSWLSIWDLSSKDATGNAVVGNVIAHDSNNNYIKTDDKLVATLGIDDSIVVASNGAVLVAHKDRVQDLAAIAKQIPSESMVELEAAPNEGHIETEDDILKADNRFELKRRTLKPGENITFNISNSAGEHLLVVEGRGILDNSQKSIVISRNQCLHLSPGIAYELKALDEKPLEMIGFCLVGI